MAEVKTTSKRAFQIGAGALVVVSLGVIIWSVSILMQGPTSDQEPNAAEWLSAISTFWGAVAAAVGAALTGGALLIAAMTYQRQVRDRHAELADKRREEERKRREHAEAVTVVISKHQSNYLNLNQKPTERLAIKVHNDGDLAIFGLALVQTDHEGNDGRQQFFASVLPGQPNGFVCPGDIVGGAYAMFTDTAGTRWKRWHNGDLVEIPHYPTSGD